MALSNEEKNYRTRHRAILKRTRSFTKCQKEVVGYLLNLWLNHRNAKGYIHPGRSLIMEKCAVSRQTVNTTFSILREYKILNPVGFEKGGYENNERRATRYVMDLVQMESVLWALRGTRYKPHTMAQDVLISVKQGQKFDPKRGTKIRPCTSRHNVIYMPKVTPDEFNS